MSNGTQHITLLKGCWEITVIGEVDMEPVQGALGKTLEAAIERFWESGAKLLCVNDVALKPTLGASPGRRLAESVAEQWTLIQRQERAA